ncbi:hypothetical protein BCD48_16085 [Pseudofrankia sp. BMG5.36]|nr:hypothetical protein BCD48_16085 [Pseudofrankia sp. BMG5.36]
MVERPAPDAPGNGAPGPTRGRIVGVDAARGAALLGMVATHVIPPLDAQGRLTTAHLVAAGRAAAAFAVLAGVALTLVTARAAHPRTSTFARAVCIGAIGLALGLTSTPVAVILPYYAVFFVLALPLLRAPRWVLAVVAASALLVEPVLSQLVRPHLPEPLMSNPSFDDLVVSPWRLALTILLSGYYPALAWIGYLCAGMFVGRLDLRRTRVAGLLLGTGAAVAVAASALSWLLLGPLGGRDALLATSSVLPGVGPIAPSEVPSLLEGGLYGSTPTQSWWWLAVDTPHTSAPLDLLHTTGTAVALLGAALLVARLGAAAAVVIWPLAAVGSMTLTWYTLHAWVLSTELPRGDSYAWLYLQQVIPMLVLASLWRLTGRRGPLEAVISALARRASAQHSPGSPAPPRASSA